MKVESPAGEFESTIQESFVEENCIVIKGQMGVWDSKIYLESKDVLSFLLVLCKPQIILHLLKLPLYRVFKR